MYNLTNYGEMISDTVRTDAYAAALRNRVGPGSVVVDLGTGTGIFALLACQFGARKVFAIEPSDAIQVARDIARDNGFSDRIEFIQALSTDVELPERVDVIVSDLHGMLPFHQQHVGAIIDARARMLAPGGSLIPRKDSLWAACIGAPEQYRKIESPWIQNEYGLDMRSALSLVTNQLSALPQGQPTLLTAAGELGAVDYNSVADVNFRGASRLEARRSGAAHGLCVWFDALIDEDIGFSNAPGKPELVYGRAYFPWPEPVELVAGMQVDLKLHADSTGDDYLWTWETRIEGVAHFKQTSLFAEPLSPQQLRKTAANHVPTLNEHGLVDHLSLALMGQGKPLEVIAKELAAQFPRRFRRVNDALSHVGQLSARYSQ